MRNATKNGMAIAGLILAVIMGNALAGIGVIGYHAECIDAIDNDGDGQTDGMDLQCAEYPYSDGNGESETPMEQRSTSSDSYASFFEYHETFMDPLSQEQVDTICILSQTQGYDSTDQQKADEWQTANPEVNCQAGGP